MCTEPSTHCDRHVHVVVVLRASAAHCRLCTGFVKMMRWQGHLALLASYICVVPAGLVMLPGSSLAAFCAYLLNYATCFYYWCTGPWASGPSMFAPAVCAVYII
jgi:hypothetical protein